MVEKRRLNDCAWFYGLALHFSTFNFQYNIFFPPTIYTSPRRGFFTSTPLRLYMRDGVGELVMVLMAVFGLSIITTFVMITPKPWMTAPDVFSLVSTLPLTVNGVMWVAPVVP